ncbi:MAG: dienelactone hydrolase family protein [Burkholderiales bacterium]
MSGTRCSVAFIASLLAALLLVACAGTTIDAPPVDRQAEIARTWDQARVHLPGRLDPMPMREVAAERPWPVVLYFHGCTGIGNHDLRWGAALSAMGVAVVQPDSFARTYRRANCAPKAHKVNLFPEASRMREEEIQYAVARARATPWIDSERIFVMGHSEGGLAAMITIVPGVRGTIVSGWACSSFNPRFIGIPQPNAHPLLIFGYDVDPWYAARNGSCLDHLMGRSATEYARLGSAGHNTAESALAHVRATTFIRKHLQ